MAYTDLGFLDKAEALLEKVRSSQADNVSKATDLMVEAIKKDELIHVYGGGGHTTLVMGEMFFRAGGLANIPGPEVSGAGKDRELWRLHCQILQGPAGRGVHHLP